MKKILILFLLSVCSVSMYAQVPNGSFENWNSTPYSDPTGWQTGNQQSVSSLGVEPITQVNGMTGSAVRMITMNVGGTIAQAYIANGDPFSGDGGIPCGQQPTAVTGFYRYNIQPGDSAIFIAVFKKNGAIYSTNIFSITGTQNNFTTFSFPLSLSMAPDSVIIAAASSNLIANVGVQAGSFLELDGLAFTGAAVTIPNAGFENWSALSYDVMAGWEFYGDVTKTTDSYAGTFAVKLATVDYGGGNISSAGITSGHNTNNGSVGGVPYNHMTDTLTGYYKYFTNGNDSASIYVNLSSNGSGVGGNGMLFAASSNYTYFEMPLNAGSMPDTMRIDAYSSKWPVSASAIGSTLYLDDLVLKSQGATGVFSNEKKSAVETYIYPNPANNASVVKLPQPLTGAVSLVIYDVSGRIVQREDFKNTGMQLPMNIESLNTGMYYYEVSCGEIRLQNKFIKK